MSTCLEERIKANLNLYAVLQNFEDLLQLDAETAGKARGWNISIQFSVKGGPEAHVAFSDGVCTHGRGRHPNPSIKLFFTSPKHLNAVFDGKATPIPTKGFTKLGFLSQGLKPLTDRLTYYLKPQNGRFEDEACLRTNTVLLLHTAVFAVAELALLEPASRHLAAQMGEGVLQVEVLPEGPYVQLTAEKGLLSAAKQKVDHPRARMTFRSLNVANDLLNGRLDNFRAVVQGDIVLKGYMPLLDNASLILGRVQRYLS